MKHHAEKYGFILAAALLSITVTACQPNGERLTVVDPATRHADQQPVVRDGADRADTKRQLTVVRTPKEQTGREVTVAGTHKIKSATIQSWISEDEVEIETIRLVKAGTETEEPQYEYKILIMNLLNGQTREPTGEEGRQMDGYMFVKETFSPEGEYSFIQKWKDKYTADNFVKDRRTGELIEIPGDNYLELGGWLNADTYILAAGSMNGRGEIRQISAADGNVKTLPLEDPDVDIFTQFGVSHGRIYYTDNHQVLKVFDPGQTKPVSLIRDVWNFQLSPNSQYISVSTVTQSGAFQGSELLIYDSAGTLQGTLIGKGDLITYVTWSPDSDKLAFDVYTEKQPGMNGVYLFDTQSGQVSPLAPYYAPTEPLPHPTYPLSWSPSGHRLGITVEDSNSQLVTQVIDFIFK
ncbi:WD40 repeat domain-containing protein [Paenibacillus rubinfantis]|uniref:WD40 repeat domain-containing protein n=1 Tax=Paenibacillus rubinfantis TaxID=1720296 RepID=UPI00073EF0AF|nr:WD40 repeat domain-containing protein [Paenibacillus rubinfantis]